MKRKPLSTPSTEIKMTEFTKKVLKLIKSIPKGRIATYGQIAELAGKPHGARGVGWILNSCTESHQLPWQRVMNSKGKISFAPKSAEAKRQKKLLMSEGVKFEDDLQLDLEKYQWKKKARRVQSKLTPSLFS